MQQTRLAADTLPMEADAGAPPSRDAKIARLSSALREMGEEHRIVLCLHFLEELSLAEIAIVLDDSEESVRDVYLEAVTLLCEEGRRRDAA